MAQKQTLWGRPFSSDELKKFEIFNLIDNYIYFYHLDKFLLLPAFVDSASDIQSVDFKTTSVLSRSAPIYSYSNSGPRTVQVKFNLHRDLMLQINKEISNVVINVKADYVDYFIKYIQAAVVPSYQNVSKMVNPPIIALRLGNDIFIKGVIQGQLSLYYGYPILEDGRYANVSIQFTIAEIDPYDANDVINMGSYRAIRTSLNSLFTNASQIQESYGNNATTGGVRA